MRGALTSLATLFENSIRISHLMEELVAVPSHDLERARREMHARKLDVIGIAERDHTAGYLHKDAAEWVHFRAAELVADSASLKDALPLLLESERFFVLRRNRVTGIVTRADLAKQPFRLYCFGVVTLLEMQLLALVRSHFDGDAWASALKSARVESAKKLYEERTRRGEEIGLVDCLQFCDKRDLVLLAPALIEKLGLESKTNADRVLSDAEQLRNNLAHGQNLDAGQSWPDVIALVLRLEACLERSA